MRSRKPGFSFAATVVTLLASRKLAGAECGDFNEDGAVTASDSLGIMAVAVGSEVCDAWTCDVDDSGSVTASDSLRALQAAVGQPVTLDCPVNPALCVSDLDFFFAQVWTPILTDCVGCHTVEGAAGYTAHILIAAVHRRTSTRAWAIWPTASSSCARRFALGAEEVDFFNPDLPA